MAGGGCRDDELFEQSIALVQHLTLSMPSSSSSIPATGVALDSSIGVRDRPLHTRSISYRRGMSRTPRQRQMKRSIAVVAALGLLVGACGSDDEAAPTTAAGESTETTGTPPDDTTGAVSTTDQSDGSTDEGAVAAAGAIRSLDDIPDECLAEMADFLRAIEPIVSATDWETATLTDFEQIAGEFEAIGNEFDASSESLGCNDLDFVDDNESDLLAEFAKDKAPGTVGFLEFISALGSIGSSGDDGGASGSGAGALETCAEGIEFVQGLVDNYDSLADVPAAELVKFAQISSIYLTCTPEQLDFFDSDEVVAFIEG